MLDEDTALFIEEIEDEVIPHGREERIFEDCIRLIRKNKLKTAKRAF